MVSTLPSEKPAGPCGFYFGNYRLRLMRELIRNFLFVIMSVFRIFVPRLPLSCGPSEMEGTLKCGDRFQAGYYFSCFLLLVLLPLLSPPGGFKSDTSDTLTAAVTRSGHCRGKYLSQHTAPTSPRSFQVGVAPALPALSRAGHSEQTPAKHSLLTLWGGGGWGGEGRVCLGWNPSQQRPSPWDSFAKEGLRGSQRLLDRWGPCPSVLVGTFSGRVRFWSVGAIRFPR